MIIYLFILEYPLIIVHRVCQADPAITQISIVGEGVYIIWVQLYIEEADICRNWSSKVHR